MIKNAPENKEKNMSHLIYICNPPKGHEQLADEQVFFNDNLGISRTVFIALAGRDPQPGEIYKVKPDIRGGTIPTSIEKYEMDLNDPKVWKTW